MIVGIGVDVVGIERFGYAIERTPKLLERLFTASERGLGAASLAARFAAKEAFIKALPGQYPFSWQDLEIVRTQQRAPMFVFSPRLERYLDGEGIARTHLSLTHDAGTATAFVVMERRH